MPKNLVILLVEDNPVDVLMTKEAITEDSGIPVSLVVARDGVEAMAYLNKEGQYHSAARPHLIVLDLNLPKKNGKEVLKEIKADKELKEIPVIILSSSSDIDEIAESYDLHANCFIVKPMDVDKFLNVVKSIKDFWLNIVHLPGED